MSLLQCPMCTFCVLASDNYVLQLHFEQEHTEDSPFRIEDDPEPLPHIPTTRPSSQWPKHASEDTPSNSEDESCVLCPDADCGEVVLLSDFNDHLDLHAAATLSFDQATGKYHSQPSAELDMHPLHHSTNNRAASKEPSFLERDPHTALPTGSRGSRDDGARAKKKGPRARGNSSASEKSTLSRSIAAFNPFSRANKTVKVPQSTARLGRAELGPHAWEERMPKWLLDQLAAGPKVTVVNRIGRDGRLIKQEVVQNESPGLIPVLAQLSALDRSVKTAYYCHPSTLHIGKTPREGGFCGYRNIQMLISYIQGAHAQGQEEFPGRTPGILKLQDLIERAWDKGINEIGRQQTGGIRNTRKYIGTPEAQALFLSSQIDCAVELFTDSPDGQIEAHEQLLYAIESYFAQAAVQDDGSGVIKTLLPPIYLQQPGHSVTIIGFERRKDGSTNLVVFDPMYHTSPAMQALIGRKNIRTPRPEVLQAYRRGARQLRKHASFEALMLTAFPPLFPAWDVLRQFPDCRYVYAFFRSKTLGYDVYPEDHFLRNFPWQQYGGLWMVDEARFARAERINPLTAQALRRITGEGACPPSTTNSTTAEAYGGGHSIGQLSSNIRGMRSAASSRSPSLNLMSSMDGSMMQDTNPMGSVLNMIGMHTNPPQFAQRGGKQSGLTLQVPQTASARCPPYASPTSPTPSAQHAYPSPVSEAGGQVPPRCGSPMSIDGSEMCGQSRRCSPQGYGRYLNGQATPGATDPNSPHRFETNRGPQAVEYVAQAKQGGVSIASPPRTGTAPGCAHISPTSPTRTVSPRTAMLKNMFGKQQLQTLGSGVSLFPPGAEATTNTHFAPGGQATTAQTMLVPNVNGDVIAVSKTQLSPHAHLRAQHTACVPMSPPLSHSASESPPSIEIANGTETSTVSPISPTGTMLRYTSHRPVDSGLLALRPLSEAQVAEYRFWRPCGRRICAFGCGGGNEGEAYAAKRLFRDAEAVEEEVEVESSDSGHGGSGRVEAGDWTVGRRLEYVG